MLEVYALHGEVFFTHRGDLSFMNGKLYCDAYSSVPVDQPQDFLSKKKQVTLDQNDIDVFWIRTDPPFDESYLMDTYLLSIAENGPLVLRIRQGPSKLAGKSLVSALFPILSQNL